MNASGSRIFDRSPEELWGLLMSPEVLEKCVPGCERLEATGPGEYRVVMKVSYGPFGGRLEGRARLVDAVKPHQYKLEVHAEGKAGSVDGVTEVRLARLDGGQRTELSYDSHLRLGGLLSGLWGRFFDSAARSFLDQFFEGLARS